MASELGQAKLPAFKWLASTVGLSSSHRYIPRVWPSRIGSTLERHVRCLETAVQEISSMFQLETFPVNTVDRCAMSVCDLDAASRSMFVPAYLH